MTDTPSNNEIRTLLTAEEVAPRLRKSALTIKRWARERKIPFVPVGNEYLFDPAAIDAWLADRAVQPDSKGEAA